MMDIRTINDSSVAAVAKFMSRIKPDWWDYDDAYRQLQDVSLLATLVGWYLQNDTGVKGWILCAEYKGYSCLGIENLGYDDNGDFVMEEPLEPLLMRAETYAREKKIRNLKYIIGSTGLPCHGRPITDFAAELKQLSANHRRHFDYFTAYGFVPTGFIPNCYGENYHGIVMIKPLVAAFSESSAKQHMPK